MFVSGAGRRKVRTDGPPVGSDASPRFSQEIIKGRNWVDFLRALAGGFALMFYSFSMGPEPTKQTYYGILALKWSICLIAMLIQTVRFEGGRIRLVAPVFFIQGLSFGLLGWKAALFSSTGVWALNLMLPSTGFFLFVLAGLQLGFGQLFGTNKLMLGFAVLVTMIPLILSLIMRRQLVRLNKKTKVARAA